MVTLKPKVWKDISFALIALLIICTRKSTSSFAANKKKDNHVISNTETCYIESKMYMRLSKLIPAQTPHWVGDGFRVYPVFGEYAFQENKGISPFLMFDYAAPKVFPPNKNGKPKGVGQHPHRGFETVTIAFQGEVEHSDSMGSNDVIKSGDVQWMTAGRGVIHEEFHSKDFTKNGGVFEMCQLWVNLPKKHKMTKPRYQPILSENIPSVEIPSPVDDDSEERVSSAGIVRVISGSFKGVKGPAKTFSPVELWDVKLPTKGLKVELPYPDNHNCIVFVRKGEIDIFEESVEKSKVIGPQAVAIMKNEVGRNTIKLSAREKNTSVLIMGGEPINEPIAARGPFVMNTYAEIQDAMNDYYRGNFGQ